MFKKGNRVILVSDIFGNSPSNPVWNRQYGCVGTVISVSVNEVSMKVKWDNGTQNTYNKYHLRHYGPLFPDQKCSQLEKNNPNTTFKKAIRKEAFDDF